MVLGAVAGILVLIAAGWGYQYWYATEERAEALVQAGIRNLSPGRYEQAVEQFTAAIALNPNSWNAYYQRGFARENLQAFDEALADYAAALQLKPDLVQARTARAGILANKGDARRAIEELTQVIRAQPNAEAYFSRGRAYAALGEHERAIEDFTWVIEHLRDAPNVYLARAQSRRALGDQEGAAQDVAAAEAFTRKF
jgi:tetratricopeptide (TPR) repeat protein